MAIFGSNRSALEFMKCIGMNDEKFVCPMENSFTEVSSGLNPTLEQNPHLSFIKLTKIENLSYGLQKTLVLT